MQKSPRRSLAPPRCVPRTSCGAVVLTLTDRENGSPWPQDRLGKNYAVEEYRRPKQNKNTKYYAVRYIPYILCHIVDLNQEKMKPIQRKKGKGEMRNEEGTKGTNN